MRTVSWVLPLLSGQPFLSGHYPFPRGWPFNKGQTVYYFPHFTVFTRQDRLTTTYCSGSTVKTFCMIYLQVSPAPLSTGVSSARPNFEAYEDYSSITHHSLFFFFLPFPWPRRCPTRKLLLLWPPITYKFCFPTALYFLTFYYFHLLYLWTVFNINCWSMITIHTNINFINMPKCLGERKHPSTNRDT